MRRMLAIMICLGMLGVPVKAAEQEKLVAMTFDDGPSGRFTQRLLDGLEERGAKATFFLCGYRIEQYPELTDRIIAEGHEIGIHGYYHKAMQNMCRGDVIREIKRSLELLPENCGITFLRPPGGMCSECVQSAAQQQDLAVLHWSVDPKDWALQDSRIIKNTVLRQIRDGDVILLHDMSDSSVKAALDIVDALQAQGFQFVTASELARAKGVEPVPGKKYARFNSAKPEDVK